jgi:formate dehydrogenase accessory protein FdhE
MQVLEEAVGASANPWARRRERASELAERYPHATEILRLYQALIDHLPPSLTGEGRGGGLSFEDFVNFAVDRVLPGIVDATVSSAPPRLRDGVISVFCSADLKELIRRWLENESLTPFETYLARASISPLLEALPNKSLAALDGKFPSPLVGEGQVGAFCPTCGGLPQVSYFAVSGEALVSGPRYLVCSRCATNWIFSRMTCAGCGETDGTKLPIFQDDTQLPHMRVDGCRTCNRYLLTVDLRRDARAVPIVDELAALPLDLYATDQGLTKITPNLMGN